jgi:hypothetical protein
MSSFYMGQIIWLRAYAVPVRRSQRRLVMCPAGPSQPGWPTGRSQVANHSMAPRRMLVYDMIGFVLLGVVGGSWTRRGHRVRRAAVQIGTR